MIHKTTIRKSALGAPERGSPGGRWTGGSRAGCWAEGMRERSCSTALTPYLFTSPQLHKESSLGEQKRGFGSGGLCGPLERSPSPWAEEAGDHPSRPHNSPAPDNRRPRYRTHPAKARNRAIVRENRAFCIPIAIDRGFGTPPACAAPPEMRGSRSIQCQSGRSGSSIRPVGGRGYRQNLRPVTSRGPYPPAIRTECLARLVRILSGIQA